MKRPTFAAAVGIRRACASWVTTRSHLAVRMMSSGAGDAASKSSRLSKFHTLDIPGRISALEKAGFVTPDTRTALEGSGLALHDADNMIENVLATFGVPMVLHKMPAAVYFREKPVY
jgi:hypothetical protein